MQVGVACPKCWRPVNYEHAKECDGLRYDNDEAYITEVLSVLGIPHLRQTFRAVPPTAPFTVER